ncbi:SDR family oxidoreductase [Sneathiella marina]|uniref:SDR family oxidoreductase n=1 Tax=Sneathiella marina TaxID=2950108 RepID=A0ABY4W212_9PROT|nr:glucose 1-dehydrogenase [Sneathiella marina]USG61198.1 SDR family oxidoreductase [Sneathiella marina]
MDRVKDKITLITGAAQGIGLATARLFIAEGATVILADLNADAGSAAAEELGEKAHFMPLDVSNADQWDQVVGDIVATHGRLDILVNNAGILATGKRQTIEDTDLEQWRAIQTVNVEGVFLGCQNAVRHMKETGGAIVNLSSVAAIIGTPQLIAYGASKAAVRQMTKSVAIHCTLRKYPIRCNSVHPDPIRTAMGDELMTMYDGDLKSGWDNIENRIPIGTPGEPIDIANSVLFLASDEARHMTGSELVIDGGLTAT